MKGFEAIVEVFETEGVDTIFGYMSEDNMELLAEMAENRDGKFRFVHSRHEQGAVAMADGYYRTSGNIGVCSVGRGPAIAQTGTALTTARKRGSKILVVVPEPAFSSTYAKRDIDSKAFEQEAFLNDTLGTVIRVNSQETIVPKLRDAFRRLRVGEGPIAVQIPRDMLNTEIDSAPTIDTDPETVHRSFAPPPFVVQPDTDQINNAVELFLDSDVTKIPTIVAGMGAVSADAKEPILELAERLNAVLVTSLQARGFFDGHPYSVGFMGDYGRNIANEYVLQSDFVLAIGCSLNSHTTDSGHVLTDDTKSVHIDANAGAIERYTNVDIGIVGDARLSVQAILDEVENRGIDRSGEFWTEKLRDDIASAPAFDDRSFEPTPGTVDPRELVRSLDERLPDDRIVVCDGGQTALWVMDGINVPGPGDFIWSVDFAGVGLGLPVGIGATTGTTDRPCVAFCGDASFMMAIQELETAARYNIPLTIFVLNDSTIGMEYHQLVTAGYHGESSVMPTPDLAGVARSFGAEGLTVRSVSDLDEVEQFMSPNQNGPVVVDCLINRNVRHSTL